MRRENKPVGVAWSYKWIIVLYRVVIVWGCWAGLGLLREIKNCFAISESKRMNGLIKGMGDPNMLGSYTVNITEDPKDVVVVSVKRFSIFDAFY